MKIVGATGLGGLWALEWAWHMLSLRSQFSIFDRLNIYPRSYLRFFWGLWAVFGSIDRYWREQFISVKIFILASKL